MSTFQDQVVFRTMAQEVRGEPFEGQKAVAHVLLNRVKDGRWGKTLASVCLWRGQVSGWYVPRDPNFSYACSLADGDSVLIKMSNAFIAASTEADFTKGATHYLNDNLSNPDWDDKATFCGQWGRHKFYKDVK